MVDSWGDGWNGGSIDVSIGGNVVANWTLVLDKLLERSVYTINGDNVSFTWNGGSWDSEVSFAITDQLEQQFTLAVLHQQVQLFN